jgi:hypothetical protein
MRAARNELLACASAECPSVVRKDCERWLDEVDASMPTWVLAAKDERGTDLMGARASVDGAPVAEALTGKATPIDPGPHAVRFEHEGYGPVTVRVLVREGEKNRLVNGVLAPVAPAVPSSSLPPVAWVSGSVAVAAAITWGVLGATAYSDYEHMKSTCAPTGTCASSAVDDVRARATGADVAMGVTLAAAAVFVVTLVVSSTSANSSTARATEIRKSALRMEGAWGVYSFD